MDKIKATERLSNINFDMAGAHVALVGKHQGGPANQYTTLVTKSVNPVVFDVTGATDEVKKQLTQIQVNLSMEEFLRKFFDMWHSDAELLTSILGFETEHEAWLKENENTEWNYQDWLSSKVSNFTVMKSLNDKESVALTGEQYVDIMKSQQKFESGTSDLVTVSKAKFDNVSAELELVKKSFGEVTVELESVKKSLLDTSKELSETQAELQTLKDAESQRVLKSREDRLAKVIPRDQVGAVMKALSGSTDEDFEVVLKQFSHKFELDNSDLDEQGADVELDELPEAHPVLTVSKSKVADKIREKFPQTKPA